MSERARLVKKQAVSGSIKPRWPKARVVRWLQVGAISAVLGLWRPDWLGAYGDGAVEYLPSLVPAFLPLLTYMGAVVLLVACYQGVKGMGGAHFRGVVASGALCSTAAAASVVLQLLGQSALSLLATGFAAVFAAGFFWFTIGKVAEITQETRTRVTWHAVAFTTTLTAAAYLSGVYLYAGRSPGRLQCASRRRGVPHGDLRALPLRRAQLQDADVDRRRFPSRT